MTRQEADALTTKAGAKLAAARENVAEVALRQNDSELDKAIAKWRRARRDYKRAWKVAITAY